MKNWNDITPLRVLIVLALIAILLTLLPGCTIAQTLTTPTHNCELMDRGQACLSDHSCCKDDSDEVSYWRINYASTAGLYYYNDIPYWGYYSGYYYYYGYRHVYPWWYYYNFTPPYYYGTTTHVHCHIGNSGYVYRPRGNWRHNNKTNLTYHHDNVHTTGVNIKSKSNVPTKWRTNNVKIKNNTKVNVTPVNTTKVKTNKNNITNHPIITPPIKNNTKPNNRTNIKRYNTNKTNKSNNKVNINRSNSNKTNTKINNSNRNNIKRSNTRKPK